MGKRVRSGIYLRGSHLRYAEVEEHVDGPRLLRLGSCDFEFDAEQSVASDYTDDVGTLQEALQDVFAGSNSRDFVIVLSSRVCNPFFSPVTSEIIEDDRQRLFEREAALVCGSVVGVSVESRRVDLKTDEAGDWYQVIAVPDAIRDNMATALSDFDGARIRFMPAVQASANVAARLTNEPFGPSDGPVSVVAGRYADHADLSIVVGGSYLFGQTAVVSNSGDLCYHLVALLDRAGVEQARVTDAWLCGEALADDDLDSVRSVLGIPVKRIDPLQAVTNDPLHVGSDFDPGQYVLCVGGAL